MSVSAWWCAFCATRCATDFLPALNNHRCLLSGSLPSHCCPFVALDSQLSTRLDCHDRQSSVSIGQVRHDLLDGFLVYASSGSDASGLYGVHLPDEWFRYPAWAYAFSDLSAKKKYGRLCLADDKSVEGSGGSSAQLVSADHVRYAGRPEPSGRRATRS